MNTISLFGEEWDLFYDSGTKSKTKITDPSILESQLKKISFEVNQKLGKHKNNVIENIPVYETFGVLVAVVERLNFLVECKYLREGLLVFLQEMEHK